jgi:glutaminyl-peptide cyclotransferase
VTRHPNAGSSARRTLPRRCLPLVAAVSLLSACGSTPAVRRSPGGAPIYGYKVVHVYPHDPGAFTQGLIYLDGFLWEGTGLKGRSSIRKVKLETGEVLEKQDLPTQYFGEGITDWGPNLIELTWQAGVGFVYQREGLQLLRSFTYPGEGWGLTHDSTRLIMSDGTSVLRFWYPQTFDELGRLPVTDGGQPVNNLNELEYVKGEIYANVWQTDRIACISPKTGHVDFWIDLSGILPEEDRVVPVDVLNGIAYDAQHDRLFVTGKLWPKLFQIQVIKK